MAEFKGLGGRDPGIPRGCRPGPVVSAPLERCAGRNGKLVGEEA